MVEKPKYISRIPLKDQSIVDQMVTILPPWILFDERERIFKVTFNPVICQKCGIVWYPRIKSNGQIVIPRACAKRRCRNKLWWKKR